MSKKRYYVAQFCNACAGWTDIPGTATQKKFDAEIDSKAFANANMKATRVVRKPKGWEPPKISARWMMRFSTMMMSESDRVDVSSQALETRNLKRN